MMNPFLAIRYLRPSTGKEESVIVNINHISLIEQNEGGSAIVTIGKRMISTTHDYDSIISWIDSIYDEYNLDFSPNRGKSPDDATASNWYNDISL
ncbi:hypothetical protein [Runella limosa]|uniref:hypothetical protein n=1 Tax=Runella limosa TaxID=370978 RepID=UPI00042852F6|nr:hypothetical protein [Runella limosa]